MKISQILSCLSLLTTVSPSRLNHNPRTWPRTKTLYQFPNPTWIENLAIHSCGQILVTLLNQPSLYSLSSSSSNPAPRLLYQFPSATGLLGITEVYHDAFAVVAGNFSLATLKTEPGSYSIWKVDFRFLKTLDSPAPVISKVVDIPEAVFLNGATVLPKEHGTILVADSGLGAVWKVNIDTGSYEKAIQIPEFAPVEGSSLSLEIKGLQVFDGYLHFTNSNRESLSRVPVSSSAHVRGGAKVDVILSGSSVDDFTIARDGTVWLCTNSGNTLLAIRDGEVRATVGKKTALTVAGDTSVRFGKGAKKETLLVSTNGGLGAPVIGTIIEGGKVVAVDAHRLYVGL